MPDLFRQDYLVITDNLAQLWEDGTSALESHAITGNGVGEASVTDRVELRPGSLEDGHSYRVRLEVRNSSPDPAEADACTINVLLDQGGLDIGPVLSDDWHLTDDPDQWLVVDVTLGPVANTQEGSTSWLNINVTDTLGVEVRRVIVSDEATVTTNRGPVRLEVSTPDASGLTNLIPNPSGDLGAWSWITPISGSTIASAIDSDTEWRQGLIFTSAAAASNYFTSSLLPINPSDYVGGAYWQGGTSLPSPLQWRISWIFYNSNGTVTHSSTPKVFGTGTYPDQVDRHSLLTLDTVQAGSGDAYVAVKIELGNVSGTFPLTDAGEYLAFRDFVVLRNAASTVGTQTLAELAEQLVTEHASSGVWVDLLGDAHDLEISRESLNLGTLSARLVNPALDPADDDTVRPGRTVRVIAYDPDTALFEPLFRGTITNARVDYAPLRTAQGLARDRTITLSAVDDTTALANATAPDTVATVAELPQILEGVAIPYVCDGSSQQAATADVVIVNDNASALDQVAITRDTVHGYAWVDRYGVLQVWTDLPAGVWATLTTADYNPSLAVDFDTARCINEVIVRRQWTHPTAGPQETVYGPYRDLASIAEWGRYRAEFTVAGTDPDDIPDFAGEVLDANATPTLRVTSLAIPVTSERQLQLAHVDLYARLEIDTYDTEVVPATITHTIACTQTGGQWLVGLEFDTSASVATPTVVPGITSELQQRPHIERHMSSAQTIPTAAHTVVLHQADDVDEGGIAYSAGGYTVPKDGLYLLRSGVRFGSNDTGTRYAGIFKGATFATASQIALGAGTINPTTGGSDFAECGGLVRRLAEGDTVWFTAYQASGGDLGLSTAEGATCADITWLSP